MAIGIMLIFSGVGAWLGIPTLAVGKKLARKTLVNFCESPKGFLIKVVKGTMWGILVFIVMLFFSVLLFTLMYGPDWYWSYY